MFTEFKHTLRKMRGSMIGWAIGLGLYGMLMSWFYPYMVDSGMDLTEIYSSFPPEMMAFFPSLEEIASPVGYLNTYFLSYIPMIFGIFAAGACANLISKDEESGILDLQLSYPISRTKMFWGRFFGFLVGLFLVNFASYLSWVVAPPFEDLGFTYLEFFKMFVPLYAILVLAGGFSLFLSMTLPSKRMASGITSALLIANFLLVGLSNINENLKPFYDVTPFAFFQGAEAVEGINWEWFWGLLGVGMLFTLLSWLLFQRRDIRVSGEGSFRVPEWLRLKRK